jgi:transglutaminase-like putative cysteine protease
MSSHHTGITPELIAFAAPSFTPGRPVLECAWDLTNRIYTDFRYDSAATDVATTVNDLLKIGRGVCQDFAHLMIGSMRAFGLPARYVSGYLLTYPPVGKEKLVGSDASHAWVSVWAPEIGWVDYDPTNRCFAGEGHVVVARGRDYSDVSPTRGVFSGGGGHRLSIGVTVEPETTAPVAGAEAPAAEAV